MPLTAALLAVALAATAKAAPAAPWDGPPLHADPSAVASAAAAAAPPKDAAVDVLLDEATFSFDAAGRCTTTRRLVYRALTRQAAEAWARVSGTWAPWSEERPDIRARVVTRSGEVRLLDPATLTESGVDAEDEGVYTDRRTLHGPLPAAEAGAVVEEVITIRETAPVLAAGVVRRWYAGVRQPTRRVRLRLEAPSTLPLTWRARGGAAPAARDRVEGGRRTVEWIWDDVAPAKEREGYRPPDAPLPQVMFTTAPSWAAVAAQYGALLERQLAGDELADVARSVVARGEPADRAAQKLLDWISERVRYTGLELGESAIVPARARETLARQFGDCKDLSLLLAGLLRASGHPATLALLRTRLDEVVPELPGFGLFDHAIVVLPGPRPLFIDPTSPETPVGELPPGDQGRLALVIAPGTGTLVRTPEAGAAENRIVTSREIVLPEHGWAHVVETRELSGAPAARLRDWRRYAGADRAKLAESDAKAVKERLNAETYVAASYDGVEDARARVRVRLEADQSHWAITRDDDAEAVASAQLLAERLPAPLKPAADGKKEPPAREEAVWVSEPHASELRYRIVPPPGFRVVDLPAPTAREVGAIRLESRFVEGDDGAVTVTHRLEVGARRIAPASVAAIRAALVDVVRPDDPKVRFRRTSTALLQAGKGREALQELRRLVALHPHEARHHNHLALALVRLGMRDAARREAQRAIELEPKNAWSHRVLALVLSYDEIGRYLAPRCDLAGAVAAQRRAAELDPTAGTRARLAFLLEHDAQCERLGEGARLDEAIAVYRAIHDELKSTEYDEDYLEALVAGGRFQEALALARATQGGQRRDAALVAAAAALEGPDAAARETERLSPDARGQALQGALRALLRARRYPAVAALLRAASAGAPTSAALQAQAASFERIRRHEEVPLDPKDPAALPRQFFRAIFGADRQRALQPLVAKDLSPAVGDGTAAMGALIARTLRKQNLGGLGNAVLVDICDSLMEVRVDGDPAVAVRLTIRMPNAPTTVFYAVRRGDGFKLVATFSEQAGLADVARSRAEAGDLVNARRLLGWARDEGASARHEDSPGAILAALWTHGADAGVEELRAAAAALEAAEFPDRAVPLLAERRRATPEGPARRALSWGLAAGYRGAKRWADALALADELLAADPASEPAFGLKVRALTELGRTPSLRASLEARLRAEPESAAALRLLAGLAIRAGDVDEIDRHLRRLVELGKAEPMDYNNLAWAGLLRPTLPPDAISQAQKAAQLTGEQYPALHTLATLHAVRGEPAEAMQVLLKAIEQGSGDPGAGDWLVIGRIAEHYGLTEDAAAAYARAIDGPGPDADAASTSALARRWAARLQRR
jgi:tetratricopeptide (TPR) repeat protein/transglutaminase-like putative cysteine protease